MQAIAEGFGDELDAMRQVSVRGTLDSCGRQSPSWWKILCSRCENCVEGHLLSEKAGLSCSSRLPFFDRAHARTRTRTSLTLPPPPLRLPSSQREPALGGGSSSDGGSRLPLLIDALATGAEIFCRSSTIAAGGGGANSSTGAQTGPGAQDGGDEIDMVLNTEGIRV